MTPLFTIGHSTHDFAEFLGLLKQHGIEVVADVRSRPFSRFPWFCGPALKEELKGNGLHPLLPGQSVKRARVEKGNRFQSAVVAFGIITAGLVFLGYAINFS